MGRLLRVLIFWAIRLTVNIGVLVAQQVVLLAIQVFRWLTTLASLGLAALWTGPWVAAERLAARWRQQLIASGIPAHEETPVGVAVAVVARALIVLSLMVLVALACAGLLLVVRVAGG
ncbi:MAG: hypothetical protein RB148_09460 [Armatimonadota bacterium]|nr:hypothetical protein [Armatimonadota bacterium]